jgi:hypothetical protein
MYSLISNISSSVLSPTIAPYVLTPFGPISPFAKPYVFLIPTDEFYEITLPAFSFAIRNFSSFLIEFYLYLIIKASN